MPRSSDDRRRPGREAREQDQGRGRRGRTDASTESEPDQARRRKQAANRQSDETARDVLHRSRRRTSETRQSSAQDEPSGLEGGVPLLLLPIRLETRFSITADASQLRIRIYPDQVQIDAGMENPTEAELEAARQYWTYRHEAGPKEQRAAWRWLVERVGIHRAGHLARLARPTVARGRLEWPEVDVDAVESPGRAVFLPDRFVAIGWRDGDEIFRENGEPLDARAYHTSPDLTSDEVETTADGLTVTPLMRWMIDYDAAERRGMAITVDLPDGTEEIDLLLVVGVDRSGADQSAANLQRLIENHTVTQGFAFVQQGPPTNNTDTVEAGWTRVQREASAVEAQLRREFDEQPPTDDDDNAHRFSLALGLPDDTQLRRQAFGDDVEWRRSRSMRLLLFDTVIGRYLTEMIATRGRPALGKERLREFRDWYLRHVTGGALIPSVRVRNQPYGIIPTMIERAQHAPSPVARNVAEIVEYLRDEWSRSFDDGVPRLDHNAGESADTLPGDVAGVLAGEPHPTDIALRRLELWEENDNPFTAIGIQLVPAWTDIHSWKTRAIDDAPPTEITWVDVNDGFMREFFEGIEEIQDVAPELYEEMLYIRGALGDPTTIEEQIVLWSKYRELVYAIALNPWGEGVESSSWVRDQLRAAEAALPVADDILSQLTAHEQRQRPLGRLGVPHFNGVLGQKNPPLVVSKFELAPRPLVRSIVEEDEPAPGKRADQYIEDAATGDLGALAKAPLLAQLLQASSDAIGAIKPAASVADAIETLRDVPVEELEWLTRETLGLGMHRLDAWATGVAHERLTEIREARPTGTHVGSYGCVTELKVPEADTARSSRGFVHAPSLGQAATTAVVRSAWFARGEGDSRSPAALDLRSNRYRFAEWLLDGIRNGQALGDLLGYQFERLCHDLNIDEQIARVRQIVGDAHDRQDAIEDPVDGIELMELFDEGGLDAHLRAVTAEFNAARSAKLRLLLEGLRWAFDAVDDALLGEATHHLLAGNLERAAAVIESTAGEDIAAPELLAMRRPAAARTINHKIVVLTPAAANTRTGWKPGLRNVISPAYEALAASLLPPPGDIGVSAVTPDGEIVVTTLDQLPLSALDAVYLGSDDPTIASAGMNAIMGMPSDVESVIDPTAAAGTATVTFEEFQILATEIRRLLSEHRSATAADLAPEPGDDTASEPTVVPVGPALQPYRTLAEAEWGVVERIRLAQMGLVGDEDGLRKVLRRRIEHATAEGDAPEAEIHGRMLGREVPIGDTIDVSVARTAFDTTLASSLEVQDWIGMVGKVRPDVDRLTTIDAVGSLLGAVDRPVGCTSQWPREPDDNWAATGLPVRATGGRSVVTALWNGAEPTPTGSVVGLVVDQWSEQIPELSQVTGITVHYDAPSQRPPQAWVLGVPPDDRVWSIDLVVDTLLETFEWVRLRTVAPEDLGDFGHTIPTVFTNPDTHTEEVAT